MREGDVMTMTLIVLLLTLLAVMVVSALAFWPSEPGSKGRKRCGSGDRGTAIAKMAPAESGEISRPTEKRR